MSEGKERVGRVSGVVKETSFGPLDTVIVGAEAVGLAAVQLETGTEGEVSAKEAEGPDFLESIIKEETIVKR